MALEMFIREMSANATLLASTLLGENDLSCVWFELAGDVTYCKARARLLVEHDGLPIDALVTPEAARRRRLLVSDMDSTIIGQECIDELADCIGLKDEISAITERAMRGEVDFESALRTRVAMLKGLAVTELVRCHAERVSLTSGARCLVRTMAWHGAHTVLVSGGFTAFTERVAPQAGFAAHYANRLLALDGKLSGEVGEPILGRRAKLDRMLEEAARIAASPEDCLALGDGANDLDMIAVAGLGVAYKAKPVVAEQANVHIRHTDLRAALFFQGYSEAQFILD